METTEKHIVKKETEHEIVFFIDKQQFKTNQIRAVSENNSSGLCQRRPNADYAGFTAWE